MGHMSTLGWLGIVLPCAAIVCGMILAGISPDSIEAWGPALFLASAVFLGLPHGAVDHLVIARLEDQKLWSPRVLGRLVAYVCAALATLVVWWASPVAVFAGFIALTTFHWGQGDVWFHQKIYGARASVSGIVLAGGLPMLVPLVASPETYAEVAQAFARTAGVEVEVLPVLQMLAPWAVLVLVAAAGHRVATARSGRAQILLESVLLAAYFWWVPPVAAIAVYFCLWHAPRHIVRLARSLYGPDLRAVARTLAAAIPLTLVSIAGLAGLWGLVGAQDLFATYLALIAALTVPHVVVVTWMDRDEQVWPKDVAA